MVGLAVTLCTILTLTETAADDRLIWTNVASADVAGIRVYLNGALVASLPPTSTSYPLATSEGLACVVPYDAAGNAAEAQCMWWDLSIGVFAQVDRPCLNGVRRPKNDPRACTAPLAILAEGQ